MVVSQAACSFLVTLFVAGVPNTRRDMPFFEHPLSLESQHLLSPRSLILHSLCWDFYSYLRNDEPMLELLLALSNLKRVLDRDAMADHLRELKSQSSRRYFACLCAALSCFLDLRCF